MPTLDYVSIVRSVYGDRRALLFGAFASAFAAGLTAYRAQSTALAVIAGAFVLVGLVRYFNMRAFWRAAIDSDDLDGAEHWELRALIGGGLVAAVYGAWCLVSILMVNDPYAELVSSTLSIAAMVGVCARNFGLDRLVTIQTLLLSVPLSLGLMLTGDVYHPILAGLLVIMLVSFRKLAADIRSILLSAVHGRIEASRLAGELDMALATMQHGLCMLDDKGVVAVVNERAVRTFALLGVDQVIGQPFAEMAKLLNSDRLLSDSAIVELLDMVAQRGSGKVLLNLPRARFSEVTVSSRRDRCVLLFEDVTERVTAEERISFTARHDGLTNLPNRAYFGEMVETDLRRRFDLANGTVEARLVSLIVVDIDDFKHVNDTLGHVVGDHLLVEAGRRLRATLGPQIILARLGGDEFIAYRTQLNDAEDAERDAEAILRTFETPFQLEGTALSCTVSVGVVTSSRAGDDLNALMAKADLALYSAKGDGKAKSQTFHAEMDIDYHYRQRLKTELQQAVADGTLNLAFQPLFDVATRQIVSCEALARWTHPELGTIPPSVFIPLAEETGMITEITAWVLAKATAQCQSWGGDIGIAVNISARDFRGGDLRQMVAEALASSGLAPNRLELEVTETALIEERDLAQAVLDSLAAQGIGIALDDFGTGYSSLSYLQALPFTKLKIDRCFVDDITTNPRSLKLLANVARLGRDLNLTVVAEGIETEEQMAVMTANTSIDQVQGFLLGRPMSARDISDLIAGMTPVKSTHLIRKHG